jgi:hypothetical protein
LDSQQVLEVKVKLAGSFGGVERFYANREGWAGDNSKVAA